MNNSIYSMNHSPKTQEPESGPLPIERDLNNLHKMLVFAIGDTSARLFGLSMTDKSFDEKCAAYLEALAIRCDGDEQAKIYADIQAAIDDDKDQHTTQINAL